MQDKLYIFILLVLIIIKPKYLISFLPLLAVIFLFNQSIIECLDNELIALDNNPFDNSLPPPRNEKKQLKKDEMCNVQLPFEKKIKQPPPVPSFQLPVDPFKLPDEKKDVAFKLPEEKKDVAFKIMKDFVMRNDKVQKYKSELLGTELDDIDVDVNQNRSFYKLAGADNVDAYDEALKFLYPSKQTCKENTEQCYY